MSAPQSDSKGQYWMCFCTYRLGVKLYTTNPCPYCKETKDTALECEIEKPLPYNVIPFKRPEKKK